MEQHILVAPVGDGIKSLYVALAEFPVRKVHLVANRKNKQLAEKTKKLLEQRGIASRIWPIGENEWEETFRVVSEIASAEPEIIIHVGTADRSSQCAATSAAFVNGVYAINGDEHGVMGLPVLRFNYYTQLTERKMAILQALQDNACTSLDELGKHLGMSLPLLSYHIHGNMKTEGLVQMRLVELGQRGTARAVQLTPMARLLLKGYVKQEVTA